MNGSSCVQCSEVFSISRVQFHISLIPNHVFLFVKTTDREVMFFLTKQLMASAADLQLIFEGSSGCYCVSLSCAVLWVHCLEAAQ